MVRGDTVTQARTLSSVLCVPPKRDVMKRVMEMCRERTREKGHREGWTLASWPLQPATTSSVPERWRCDLSLHVAGAQ